MKNIFIDNLQKRVKGHCHGELYINLEILIYITLTDIKLALKEVGVTKVHALESDVLCIMYIRSSCTHTEAEVIEELKLKGVL